jgi:phosphate transport system ATP-binding protein
MVNIQSPPPSSSDSDNPMIKVDSSYDKNPHPIKVQIENLSFFYGTHQVLRNVSIHIPKDQVTALIGPSGCGKTTLLRCLNRMHDLYPGNRYEGSVKLQPEGIDIIGPKMDPIQVRMRFGMVFQKPNPFPKSIYENVAYGLRLQGMSRRKDLDERVEKALREAALWEEVKARLHGLAHNLSGGQQQRLCIARAIATDPDVVLFDEPTSALDPIATSKIEELIVELKKRVTVVIVTHNLQQAGRISDMTAFMYLGELIEFGETNRVFTNPAKPQTEDYISGRFG